MSESAAQKEDRIRVFQLNDEKAAFEELDFDESVKLHEILNPELILYFVDPGKYRSFIWSGNQTSTRMKFIAANAASNVRDRIGPAIKISTVDEGEESHSFKVMLGLEEEISYEEAQTGPAYEGRAEDDDLLHQLTLDRLTALLEKIGCPEGYTREMIIEGKNIYGYHEYYKEYMGEIIKERKLYPLQDTVPDGSYIGKDLMPRILLSYNRVVITELLRKMTEKEIQEKEDIEQKIEDSLTPDSPFMN